MTKLCEISDNDIQLFNDLYNNNYKMYEICKIMQINYLIFITLFTSINYKNDKRINSDNKILCKCCNKYKYPTEFLSYYDKICINCIKERKKC